MQQKLCSKVLSMILDSRSWKQGELAKRAHLSSSVVSWHLSRQRPIRDDHLVAYLSALDAHERPILLSAWLRDTLGAEVIRDVLKLPENRVREAVAEWSPGLTHQQKQMLDWWVHHISHDPELAEIFHRITLKAGYPKSWT